MWSLGCILAEMITGMIAVDGNFVTIIFQISLATAF